MPTRYLKESIKTSDTIDHLSWFEEVLFYRLIVSVDDYGRFDGRSVVVRNMLFPLKEQITVASVEKALFKLASVNLIVLYEVDGRRYIHLPTWNDHQTAPRAKNSRFPSPDGDSENTKKVTDCEQNEPCQADAEHMHSECNANVAVIDNHNRNRIIDNRESMHALAHEGTSEQKKQKYGKFNNVLISQNEYESLKNEYGKSTADSLIDSFSCKIVSKGYKSNNHYATILQWAKEDGVKPNTSSFDIDEFFEAALKKSYG